MKITDYISTQEFMALQHRKHHRMARTHNDPDLGNYEVYPISKSSFRRKVIRDLTGQTGQTGFKLMVYKLIGLKPLLSTDAAKRKTGVPFAKLWLSKLMMVGALHLTLNAWLYLVWLGGMMTFHMLTVRLRQVAEHASVPDHFSKDPRDNTRTTYTNWLTRLWIGPNQVNYHLDQHIAEGVPAYNLKAFHELMLARGAYQKTHIFKGYGEVIHHAVPA